MPQPATLEELKNVYAMEGVPDDLLQWILDRSEVLEFEDGDVVFKTGDQAELLVFILEGKFSFYMDVNGTLVYYLTFENDKPSGGISGLIPHSRMKTSPGTSFSIGKVRALTLHKKYFGELEQRNPEFIQKLIGYMTERAKMFATIQLQREKVSALGKLSAGIAHELNNPAAAINRIASELRTKLNENYELTARLLTKEVTSASIESIRSIASAKETGKKETLSAMKRMEKEDEILDWFTDNNFTEDRNLAETFSEFGFSTADLDALRNDISSDAFMDMLRWLENILISDRLIGDLKEASLRISTLVGAIKSHVHMDRTNDAQPTNLETDIENTLTLMGYKLRDKNITVTKKYCADMPMVDAYVGELNQVWTNLIDNAIDAMPKDGELTITSSTSKKDVTVRIIDNGAGIPNEIISRVFDPFFTTKKVGQGTGIGLDIVKKIVEHHHGEIKVNSVPGRTEFAICIPISQHHESH
jgi:signal transduction histidine kinase